MKTVRTKTLIRKKPPAKYPSKRTAFGDVFDCINIEKFTSIIVRTLPFEGVSGSRFYVCNLNGIEFLVKVGFYYKSKVEIFRENLTPQIDAEINILAILQKVITHAGVSPCIIEMVHNTICNDVQKLIPTEKVCDLQTSNPYADASSLPSILCNYRNMVDNNLAYNRLAFIVLDTCEMTLDKFLRRVVITPNMVDQVRAILFMILYTLYSIRKLLPGFRHQDLHTDNIVLKIDPLYVFDAQNIEYWEFKTSIGKFYVPYYGVIPKIIDFGHSILPEYGIKSSMQEDPGFMFYRTDNDFLFLMAWVNASIVADTATSAQIQDILHEIEPNNFWRRHDANYIRKNVEKVATYEQMLKSGAFENYRTKPKRVTRQFGI